MFVRKVVIKFYRNVKAFYKEDELELNLGKNNKGFFFSFFQVDHGALKAGGWWEECTRQKEQL